MLSESRLALVLNAEEVERRARRFLPRVVFDAIAGGATDELTMRANRDALERTWLRPRALADVSVRDLSVSVLGDRVSMPVLLAPCGFSRMCSSEAELASARAAGDADTVFALSGGSSYSLEEVAAAATKPLWYQLYLRPERKDTEELIRRAKEAGYSVLCVTVDAGVPPLRDRDHRNRLVVPLEISPKLLMAGLSRPRWSADFLLGRVGRGQGITAARTAYWNLANVASNIKAVTWDDLRWIREAWEGPLVVKGIQRGDEVARMIEEGANGFVVSNHGGRNLDGSRATIEILPEVVQAAGDRAEVLMDGGVRRGADVVKALALGARAVLIGRPYLYGLAIGGEAGVRRVLEIMRKEVEVAMGLSGCATIADIDSSIVESSSLSPEASMNGSRLHRIANADGRTAP